MRAHTGTRQQHPDNSTQTNMHSCEALSKCTGAAWALEYVRLEDRAQAAGMHGSKQQARRDRTITSSLATVTAPSPAQRLCACLGAADGGWMRLRHAALCGGRYAGSCTATRPHGLSLPSAPVPHSKPHAFCFPCFVPCFACHAAHVSSLDDAARPARCAISPPLHTLLLQRTCPCSYLDARAPSCHPPGHPRHAERHALTHATVGGCRADKGGAEENTLTPVSGGPQPSTQRAKAGGDHKFVRTDHRSQSLKSALNHASESQRAALTGAPAASCRWPPLPPVHRSGLST